MLSILRNLFLGIVFSFLLYTALWAEVDDGLVLYLPFDKPPVAQVVADESGKGNHGTIFAATYLPSGGKLGGAYEFNGVDSYIFIPQSPSLDVGPGAGLTLSAWYNTTTTSQTDVQSPLLEWGPGFQGPPGRAGVHLWVNVEGFQWHPPQNPNGGGTGANLVAAGVPFPDREWNYVISTSDRPRNEWHHLVVTYDRLSGEAKVYVDGNWEQTRIFQITPETNFDLYLGIRPTDYQRLRGLMDEVRVYNRALNTQEVQSLYDAVNLGRVYQNFEGANDYNLYGWTWNPAGVTLSMDQNNVHGGSQSWKMVSTVNEGGVGIKAQTQTWHFNAEPNRHDRLTFWIWGDPQNPNLPQQEPNNVSVKFFDQASYHDNGFEVWTTKFAEVQKWTQLTVLFTQLPGDFNFSDIDKIEFKNYWPGTYYLDDIQIVSDDRFYQAFEDDRNYRNNPPKTCTASDSSSSGNCGWGWPGTAVFVDGINFQQGHQSWKMMSSNFWAGTGLKSQEQRLCDPSLETCSDSSNQNLQQDFWHVDLNPAHLRSLGYDRVSFWLYSQGENNMDNNMGVQFFDWGTYHTEPIPNALYDKQVVWSRKGAVFGKWTQLSVPLDKLAPDLDLTDINKLQLQVYWPGTYFIDDIKATKAPAVIDQALLSTGVVSWSRSLEAAAYTLQESTVDPDNPCPNPSDQCFDPETIWQSYKGTNNTYAVPSLSISYWYRVRWENAPKETEIAPYISQWSDIVEYFPPVVLLRDASLQQGWVDLKPIPQASLYEIQEAATKDGDWSQFYQGTVPATSLAAVSGRWYRARAIVKDLNGQVIDATPWGPALHYNPNGFVKAVGSVLREEGGLGDVITLRGVNLGNSLIIEPWMFFGLNNPAIKKPTDPGYDPMIAIHDDWMFTDVLTTRFGPEDTAQLLKSYQETYLQSSDFDNMMRLGINVVRLPVYYRDIRELDGNLNWVSGSSFRFDHIDRLIEFAADRGIYVLLDLHGAPGFQSEQDNTGRMDFNKLFNDTEQVVCDGVNSTVGACYQKRTLELWQALAAHYKTNVKVAGYDLLNEPAGAQTPSVLWQLYDQLYSGIRAIDMHHLIVMEGLWVDTIRWPTVFNDWDWLPHPSTYNWTNVAYQFHYYCWDCIKEGNDPAAVNTQIDNQKIFLDGKLAALQTKQVEYNLPLMIGEFTGFGVRPVWEDYLARFNQYGLSWMNWSYKTHDSPSEWGLYTHLVFDKDLANLRMDSLVDLQTKFSLYDTANHHAPNVSLIKIFKNFMAQTANRPPALDEVSPQTVNEGQPLNFILSASDPEGSVVTFSASGLPQGANLDSMTGAFSWTPAFNQSGNYSVVFKASDGVLTDQRTVSITVMNIPQPDLIVSSLSTAVTAVAPGVSFTVSNTIKNQGTLSCGGSVVAFHLSSDAVYGGADDIVFTTTRSVGSLAKGASKTANTTLTPPATTPAGDYYVCALADSELSVVEENENNNAICTTNPIQIVSSDFIVTEVSGPSTGIIGGTIPVTSTIKNQGGNSGSFSVGFYLSNDSVITTVDKFLGKRNIGSLNSGALNSATVNVTIPTTMAVGNYYLGAIADYNSKAKESNESNNALAGNTILIQ